MAAPCLHSSSCPLLLVSQLKSGFLSRRQGRGLSATQHCLPSSLQGPLSLLRSWKTAEKRKGIHARNQRKHVKCLLDEEPSKRGNDRRLHRRAEGAHRPNGQRGLGKLAHPMTTGQRELTDLVTRGLGSSHTQRSEGAGEACTPNDHRAEGAHTLNGHRGLGKTAHPTTIGQRELTDLVTTGLGSSDT